ncbi:MAG: TetR family transcriptional regulator [Legionellales bacterium]|nr:MAG: TetR family transcriptional regulator [Legionellales bacterium]
MARTSDKRDRLITAATDLILQHGYNQTVLALIATHSGVPLGNVYYYFKTKDAIGEGVVARLDANLTELLTNLELSADPLQRLQEFISASLADSENIAKYGCAIGSLCQELCKQNTPLAAQAAALFHKTTEWLAQQLNNLGVEPDVAKQHAMLLLANLQGAKLLTLTFKDPAILQRQAKLMTENLHIVINATTREMA